MAEGRLELTKMSVHEQYHGSGIGTLLCQQEIHTARRMGASELVLFSHSRLENALHIYRKLGFVDKEVDKPDTNASM